MVSTSQNRCNAASSRSLTDESWQIRGIQVASADAAPQTVHPNGVSTNHGSPTPSETFWPVWISQNASLPMTRSILPGTLNRSSARTTLGTFHFAVSIDTVGSSAEGCLSIKNSSFVENDSVLDSIVAVTALRTFCVETPIPAIEMSILVCWLWRSFANCPDIKFAIDAESRSARALCCVPYSSTTLRITVSKRTVLHAVWTAMLTWGGVELDPDVAGDCCCCGGCDTTAGVEDTLGVARSCNKE
uniref:(northern house mosquito) hypothetical protein n=1 Tax=Culex pipiens TaxID=7175 RepID=A0A8D8F6F1_CULPI